MIDPVPIEATAGAVQQGVSPSKSSEESISDAMSQWMAAISKGTKRMSEDEAYRLQIAKDLS